MHLFLSHTKSHTRKRRQHEFLTSEPRLRVYEFFSEVTPRVDNWINSKSEVTVTVLPREPTEIQVDNIWENSLQQDVAKTRHFSTALFAFYNPFYFNATQSPPSEKDTLDWEGMDLVGHREIQFEHAITDSIMHWEPRPFPYNST